MNSNQFKYFINEFKDTLKYWLYVIVKVQKTVIIFSPVHYVKYSKRYHIPVTKSG